jgi:hypothetical protein
MTNQEILGDIGEVWYHAHFGGIPSIDKYDSSKDHTDADGKEVEIKTQSRHPYGCFTLDTAQKNQLKKCVEVDKLIFIEYSLSDTIIVYECIDRRGCYTTMTEDNRRMACWPIEDMVIITKCKNKKLAALMRNFSNSKTLKHYD